MSKVKIVFCGVGGMGQCAHLRNYAFLPDCEVVAIIEAKKQQAELVAQRYNIPNVFYDIESFERSGIEFDGFVSAQPYRNMKNIVPVLAKFGKPIFTEKPIALSIEAAEMEDKAVKENGVVHMLGYHKRSDPAMEFAKKLSDEWRESGEFGELTYIRATMPAGDWMSHGFDVNLFVDEPGAAGQEWEPDVQYWDDPDLNAEYDKFVNYYIHQVNALRFLYGEDYDVKYAEKTRRLLTVESESGVPGVIEMSPWENTVDWQESYLIAFEKGWIRVDLPAPLAYNRAGKVTVMEDNGSSDMPKTWSPSLPTIHAMKNQAMNFVKFLAEGKKVPSDSTDAVKDLKTAKQYIDLLSKC